MALQEQQFSMNELTYRRTDDNGLSFELLVDGERLGDLVGARDTAIPYWIIDDDLPYIPPKDPKLHPEFRIVTVCSCGEYGCAHTQCRVLKDEASVVFRDFDMDCTPEGRSKQFTFTRENYDKVISQIVRDVDRQKQLEQNPS